MFSSRWLLSLLTASLLFLQLGEACVFAKRDSTEEQPAVRERRTVRRDVQFPDTNAGKTVNTGTKPRNRSCKKWFQIRDYILREIFDVRPGAQCGDNARAAVRLAFHDGECKFERWNLLPCHSSSWRTHGGADGSMLIDPTEIERPDNNGLQQIVTALTPLAAQFGVSNADILHVTGILGVIVCPGGPVIETWVGRRDARWRNPTGLLPDVNDSVLKMVARFKDMGFNVRDLMALIGAIRPRNRGLSTPPELENPRIRHQTSGMLSFYGETLNDTVPEGVFDSPLTTSSRGTRRQGTDQDDWDEDYARAHEQMSLLGQDRSKLTRCTEILPPKIDLGPLFVDRDAGHDDGLDHGVDGEQGFQPDDATSLEVSAERLSRVLRRLRGYWGNSG
ncbi:heme peroxidase [Sphaerosporella brunnea]|uniref:Peroxidase n=1 Tax=Sphaerosporella brunnea TaxID=1250544 RepID=A0A5J5F8Q3_9PEZI|nr:heme peroxidase [Sphaerosporella brunnea]